MDASDDVCRPAVAVGIDRILELVFLVSCRILVDEIYALRLLQVGVFDMVTWEEEEVEGYTSQVFSSPSSFHPTMCLPEEAPMSTAR